MQLGVLHVEDEIDFLGYLLRQLGRHLAAYDLITFHHRGANYPDALLLDAVLKRYLAQIELRPMLFNSTASLLARRPAHARRALRQGCLLRRHYEGHLVPDAPTSPGENARVLPGYPPVPEEQLLRPLRRRRELFKDATADRACSDRMPAQVLRQSINDLAAAMQTSERSWGWPSSSIGRWATRNSLGSRIRHRCWLRVGVQRDTSPTPP